MNKRRPRGARASASSGEAASASSAAAASFVAAGSLVEATAMNRYSERSARTYRGNYSTFQSRILAELPHLACDGNSAVLDLTKLQLEHVKGCTALVHRKKADGTPDSPSKTALTVIRCSIKYAYEMAKIPTPAWYADLGPFFKGLKRTAVENRRILTHRSEPGEEGEMPLPFELNRILARRMLQSEILWGMRTA